MKVPSEAPPLGTSALFLGEDDTFPDSNSSSPAGREMLRASSVLTPSVPLASTTNVSLRQRIVAACSGALATSLVVTPLDVVKVRMQAQTFSAAATGAAAAPGVIRRHANMGTLSNSYVYCMRFFDHVEPCACRTLYIFDRPHSTQAVISPLGIGRSAGTAVMANPPLRITGILDGVVKIGKQEGVSGLWRGLSPTLLMAIPATVVYYLGYEAIRERLLLIQGKALPRTTSPSSPSHSRPIGGGELWAPLLAGAAARIIAVTLISPLELVKTKMQNYGASPSLIADDLRRSIQQRGPLPILYKGLVPTLWRDVPFSAIYWASYEHFRRVYSRWLPAPQNPADHFALSFAAGATAGSIAAALTTPFDVAKTRQQVGNDLLTPLPAHEGRRSIVRHLRDIWRSEGVRGLTLGIGPRMCKSAPSCAIMIGCYEFTKNYLGG